MVSKVSSLGVNGLDVYSADIEVDIQRGLPALSVIGLGDAQVKESKDRVRSAIKNSGYDFPSKRITINLAPANIKKEGTHFDLAIALALLNSSNQVRLDLSSYIILGELSLEGNVRDVKGVFPMAMEAKKLNKRLVVPLGNAREAALVRGLKVYPLGSITEAVAFLSGTVDIRPFVLPGSYFSSQKPVYDVDFSDVKGQVFAKRAMEVAISGMHNIIMIGPPGVGKTMLARRIPTILPDMSSDEVLDVTKIYSVCGLLNSSEPLVRRRPFRSPHHTASGISLVGGGTNIKPGEITLAHNGVLFLDELPEFSRDSLESLRQPLEDGFVSISRAAKHLQFPSRFLLAAAMNPCPCGYFGSQDKVCHCSSYQIQKYRRKISGPLLDRIDIHIELQGVKTDDLMSQTAVSESSEEIRKRVEDARSIQNDRFSKDKIFFNSQMSHKQIRKYCILTEDAKTLLKTAIRELRFSARSYDKILKVARTIADLDNAETIMPEHISEAVRYRSLDKDLWV